MHFLGWGWGEGGKEEEFSLLAWSPGLWWVGSEHHLTSPVLLQILFNCKYYRGKSRGWLAYSVDAKTDTLAGFLSGRQLNWSKAELRGSNSTSQQSSLMDRSSWFVLSTPALKRRHCQPTCSLLCEKQHPELPWSSCASPLLWKAKLLSGAGLFRKVCRYSCGIVEYHAIAYIFNAEDCEIC